jgi:hypothetical protein
LNDQVKEDEMGSSCITHGGKRNVYRILMGNSEEKRPLGRLRCVWEDDIKNISVIGWGGVDWVDLA